MAMHTETGEIRQIPTNTEPLREETELSTREHRILLNYEPEHRPRVLELMRELDAIPTTNRFVLAARKEAFGALQRDGDAAIRLDHAMRKERRRRRNKQARADRRRNTRS